jgi:simple sugar transport system ATP-binding protein
MTLAENALLGWQRDARFARPLRLAGAAVVGFARELCAALDVRPAAPEVPIRALSGGNQQKLVVARELARRPRLLVVSQLTRGVDIGAIEAIYRKVIEARDGGAAVLLVSADLGEVLSLADRIAVLYRGRILKTLAREQADERELGLLLGGHSG